MAHMYSITGAVQNLGGCMRNYKKAMQLIVQLSKLRLREFLAKDSVLLFTPET